MAQINKSNLGFLGEPFQYRLAHEFMESPTFFEDLSGIVDQNMFTDPNLKVFVGVLKNYYEREDRVPSYDNIEVELRNMSHTDREIETYVAVVNKVKNCPSDGLDRTKELAEKFFRQQNIIRTANEILHIAGTGDVDKYETCVDLMNEAMTKGIHSDFGEQVFDHLNETLSDDYRVPIPTGIGKIDEVLEGGLGKGELGLIVGPSGFGKTSMTTAIASYAACSGFKVLQIVFEDRIKQIQRKHLGRITNVEAKDLSKPQYIDRVRATIEAFPDKEKLNENLRIVRFPSGEKTANFIGNFIKKLANNGFKADLVIVDYFECLKMEPGNGKSTTNEYEQEGRTMRKFEAMAGELNIAMWIPSQGTKDSLNAELVTMDKVGGSVKKIQIAHVVISVTKSLEDVENNKASLAVLKNRAGGSGRVFNNVDFNNGTCRISTDNVEEHDSLFDAKENMKKIRDDIARECFELSKRDSKS